MNELQRRALRCLDREVEVQTLLSLLHTVSTAAEEEQQELEKGYKGRSYSALQDTSLSWRINCKWGLFMIQASRSARTWST